MLLHVTSISGKYGETADFKDFRFKDFYEISGSCGPLIGHHIDSTSC